MNAWVVIPARYGSTRFPGKPLAPVAGRTLIRRTWEIAVAAVGTDRVYVATDDERILSHAQSFGAKALMTPAACRNGTERVLAAAETFASAEDVIVNLQGDAVLTPPHVITEIVRAFEEGQQVQIATPAVRLRQRQYEELRKAKEQGQSSGTLVVFDRSGDALYFSKSMIPFVRDESQDPLPVFRHIGLYGYRLSVLRQLSALPASPLEQAEQLEQLRALENGISIRVVQVDYGGRTHWSIDRPEDVAQAEALLQREGEIIPGLGTS